jgi:broad specificity phosphatase PhoE
MKKVKIVVMRHGEKQDGKALGISNDLVTLTQAGAAQVVQSATNNLIGYVPDALRCSKKYRAMETVLLMTSVLPLKNNGVSIIAEEGFDYSDMPGIKNFGTWEAEAKKRVAEGQKETMAMWLDIAPEAIGYMREKMSNALLKTAIEVVEKGDKDEYIVFVGNHSPVAETACVDPAVMPRLREADIVVYTVDVEHVPGGDDFAGKITASDYIPRGF